MATQSRTYVVCVDREHPAYLKRGIIRRDDGGDMVLIEWCTWSKTICTWVFRDALSGVPEIAAKEWDAA